VSKQNKTPPKSSQDKEAETASSGTPPATEAAAPGTKPALDPVVTLGMVKVTGGYSVIKVTTLGYEVIGTEILGDPEVAPKEHADNLLKYEVIKQFMWQPAGVKA
jgi:hypothetical protein